MRQTGNKSLIAIALAGGIVCTLGAGSVAVAASHSGTIHGCVKTSNGALRVVKHASDCGHGETALSFNATGPRGPRGLRGPAGVAPSPAAFQMYANLDAEGDLGSNFDAVSAKRVSTGEYQVVFDRPIGACAAVAQAGQAGGTDPIFPVPSAVSFDATNADAWDIEFVDSATRTAINTSMMITVTCGGGAPGK